MNDSQRSDGFRVDQIDHVELFVPDRYQAAEWYRQVFGLKIVPEYEHWAVTRDLVKDHTAAYSLYFNDPFGHRLELTTYQYEDTRNLLG